MHPKLKDAVALFNRREYFSSHELLEEAWHEVAANDKDFYEGLIRLATGFHLRFNRRGLRGAINLLTQGLVRLENYRPTHHGVNVARLYDDIEAHVATLKATTNPDPGFFDRWRAPRIYLVDS